MSTTTMPIANIKIGIRHRKDMGDIDGLARSIAELGLLHPIVVKPDGLLIAGERRLAACKQLGWTDVPVAVVDVSAIARGEFAENTERKDFTWSEAVAIKRVIEPVEKVAAKARQGTRTDKHPGKLPESSKGDSRDKAAKATGKKTRSLAKAEAVVAAAERDRERYSRFVDQMDSTGKVDFVFRKVKNMERRQARDAHIERGGKVEDLEALVTSGERFVVILADPPWKFDTYSDKGEDEAAGHYDTMPLDRIKALPVKMLAAKDCVLLLWGVWPNLLRARSRRSLELPVQDGRFRLGETAPQWRGLAHRTRLLDACKQRVLHARYAWYAAA
jgi:ParB-like nuclease domain/MT-A70